MLRVRSCNGGRGRGGASCAAVDDGDDVVGGQVIGGSAELAAWTGGDGVARAQPGGPVVGGGEHRRGIRVRWTVEKNDRYRFLELPDDLFEALLETMPPRDDRRLDAPLFPDLTDARLRTAITKACKATGTPHFSPHGLRRRRGSLHYKRTGSLADVAELLGDSKRVAADHYVYALTDYREVDRSVALVRARAVHTSVHTSTEENGD